MLVDLYFLGTEMHLAVFCIALLQFVFLCFQTLYFLARPTDLKRLWIILLVFFTLYYNCVSGFLPDPRIHIPILFQNILAYSGGVFVSMYIPLYIYKVYQLNDLRFYAYWGTLLFLLLPFIVCFIGTYWLFGDLDLSRKLVVIIPFLYAISFINHLQKAFRNKYESPDKEMKTEIAGVYAAVVFWISLPIIVYIDGSQLIENGFANSGFIILFTLYVKSFIRESRKEYSSLITYQQQIKIYEEEIKNKEQQIEIAFEIVCEEFDLTEREIEIIPLLAKGLTHKCIADQLSISEKTVSRHIANAYQKTGVNKKADLLKKLNYIEK